MHHADPLLRLLTLKQLAVRIATSCPCLTQAGESAGVLNIDSSTTAATAGPLAGVWPVGPVTATSAEAASTTATATPVSTATALASCGVNNLRYNSQQVQSVSAGLAGQAKIRKGPETYVHSSAAVVFVIDTCKATR